MTRFVAPDLSALAPPDAVEALDFETILSARLDDLAARLTAAGEPDAAAVLALDAEPLSLGQQTDATFELQLRARINAAVRSAMVATAQGSDLDHLAATFFGVARLEDEDDDTFRARAVLAMEARSVAGPEGAYAYFALQASPDVHDVAVYGEEDGAKYEGGDDVTAPEVLAVVLAGGGEAADGALLALVEAALNAEEVRPIGDKVTVEAAEVETYAIEGVVKIKPGADPAPLLAKAVAQAQAYAEARYRIGRVVQRLGCAAALRVTDVEEIALTSPAADIDPGSKGAAYCTGVTITYEFAEDSWR